MFRYFFTYESELPPGVGFSHFGAAHLAWLGAVAALSAAGCLWYRRQTPQRQETAGRMMALSLLGMELWQDGVLLAVGRFGLAHLPLHLCSMGTGLCLLNAFFHWDWTGQVLYALSLPGTVCALLFPDWTCYPQLNFMNLHSFLFHGAIVLYLLCQLASGRLRPRLSAVWKPLVFLLVVTPPIFAFDRRFDLNYFFVNVPLAGTPLQWMYDAFGPSGYLPVYGLTALAVMSLLLLPWSLQRRR